MSTDLDLSVPCLRCGKPSAAHGEHHPETRGMGGRGAKAPDSAHERVALCRGCHEDLHGGGWALSVDGDWARGKAGEIVLFERPLALSDVHENPVFWTEEKLADSWVQADEDRDKRQAAIAYIFWKRWGWDVEAWYKKAADLMTHRTGEYVRPGRVYEGVNLWKLFGGDWEQVKILGRTVAIAVASQKEPDKALAAAQQAREDGWKAKDIVAYIRDASHEISDGRKVQDAGGCTCTQATCRCCGQGLAHEHRSP